MKLKLKQTTKSTEAKSVVKESLFSSNSFSRLNLSAHLIDCLEKRFKLTTMTLIQEKTIPAVMAGKDCFVKSQTGSGKTLAYAIPIVQHLQSLQPKLKRTDGIQALVLVPTREVTKNHNERYINYTDYINDNSLTVMLYSSSPFKRAKCSNNCAM